jgi:hypothetical protein
MAIQGIYKVIITRFEKKSGMELHIKEDKTGIFASLKGQNFISTFFDGKTFIGGPIKESSNFIFYSAQVDELVNLTPPGGYHAGGVEFGGTVNDGTLIGTIKFKNGLIFSVQGTKIPGEPEVTGNVRRDVMVGLNRDCVCTTVNCSHRCFCDSCQIFNAMSEMPTECIHSQYARQYEKKYGKPLPPVNYPHHYNLIKID